MNRNAAVAFLAGVMAIIVVGAIAAVYNGAPSRDGDRVAGESTHIKAPFARVDDDAESAHVKAPFVDLKDRSGD
jgi:hypothetical protein